MNKNILDLNLKNHVSFKDIPEDDIYSEFEYYYIPYDISEEESEKIHYDKYMYIRKKYNLTHEEYSNIWIKKLWDIFNQFDIDDLYDYINYAKKTIKKLWWEKYFHIFYNNFLRWIILDEKYYIKFIMWNKEFFNFLEAELRDLFKYAQINREDRIWFVIDELYWYYSNSKYSWKNNEKLDNMWENDRYDFWRKFKSNWVIKEL